MAVRPWKTVRHAAKDHELRAWVDGVPTTQQIESAPAFTVFPSPREWEGPLPFGEEVTVGDLDEPIWFPTQRDSRSYDEDVLEFLKAAGLEAVDDLGTVNVNDDLRGVRLTFKGQNVSVWSDDQAWPWAIDAGYTLAKVPDRFGGKNYELYILDDLHFQADQYFWEQTPLRAQILGIPARPSPTVQADLDAINRHRTTLGMPRLVPAVAGWSDRDVALEAQRIRRLPNVAGHLMPPDWRHAR